MKSTRLSAVYIMARNGSTLTSAQHVQLSVPQDSCTESYGMNGKEDIVILIYNATTLNIGLIKGVHK